MQMVRRTQIDRLSLVFAALADPTMKGRFADLDAKPMPTTAADFGKFVADEIEKWGKVVRAANIKAG